MTYGAYAQLSTATTPALIVYLIDISKSMGLPIGNKRRVDIVQEALSVALRRMVFLSTRGSRISPRYHVAIYAYSERVYDLVGGIQPIDRLASLEVSKLELDTTTNTALGFQHVEELLKEHIGRYQTCPAPLVCHLTDGQFTGNDPAPIVKRIQSLRVNDGAVLVENIFLNDKMLVVGGIGDLKSWSGITQDTRFTDDDDGRYAHHLRGLSSPLPASYHSVMMQQGYRIAPNAVMMLPGMDLSLIEMGFVMSAATRIR
jgi:hypothetical protein